MFTTRAEIERHDIQTHLLSGQPAEAIAGLFVLKFSLAVERLCRAKGKKAMR